MHPNHGDSLAGQLHFLEFAFEALTLIPAMTSCLFLKKITNFVQTTTARKISLLLLFTHDMPS